MPERLTGQTRRDLAQVLAIFIAVVAVYFWSMPKTVVLEDDGTFILAAWFNGIAHPPGYPLYTLLAHLAAHVPVGTVAARVHAFSALLGAGACVVMWFLALRLMNSRLLAATAALAFAFSLAFWSQAIIAEVYTLNVFLFLLLFLLCLQYRDNPDSKFLFGLICFTYGLALSNHWPLLILSSPLLLAVLWPVITSVKSKLVTGICCLLAGLVPYAWLVINSHTNPVISFYGPVESLSDFLFMVSRQGYAPIDTSSTAGLEDSIYFTGFVLQELTRQFRPFGIAFVVLGFIYQWRTWPRSLATGLLLGFIGPTFILVILLNADFDTFHQNLFRVYPLVAYAIAALWLVLGIRAAGDWISRRFGRRISYQSSTGLLSILLVCSVLISNIPSNYRASDLLAHDYAQVILNSLEQDAIFFTHGDIDTGPIGYMSLVAAVRPDVTVYNRQGLVFSRRLFTPVKTTVAEQNAAIRDLIKNTERPVYFTAEAPQDFALENYGLYLKVIPDTSAPVRFIVHIPYIIRFFERTFSRGEPHDPWEKMLYRLLQSDYCRIVAGEALHSEKAGRGNVKLQPLKNACPGYYGGMELAGLLLLLEQPDWDFLGQLLSKTEAKQDEALDKEDNAAVYNLLGRYYLRRGMSLQAQTALEQSIVLWPDPGNHAVQLLSELPNSATNLVGPDGIDLLRQ